jgi:hypothetical protein
MLYSLSCERASPPTLQLPPFLPLLFYTTNHSPRLLGRVYTMSDHNSAKTQSSSTLERFNVQTVVQNQRSQQREREDKYYTAYPNRWAYIRNEYLRDFASEFLGKHVHTLFDVVVSSGALMFLRALFRYHDDHNVRRFPC